jgi:hypothetical protein
MAKQAISLDDGPDATFKSVVLIPIPGKKPVPVNFTFKYRDADEYEAFIADIGSMTSEQLVLAVASGWDLDDAFSDANVAKLLTKYNGSGMAIFEAYIKENTGAKRGN